MDRARIELLRGLIDQTVERAAGVSGGEELQPRGKARRQRLERVGARREPILIVVGEK